MNLRPYNTTRTEPNQPTLSQTVVHEMGYTQKVEVKGLEPSAYGLQSRRSSS
jgi:hypothetical protein